MGLAPARNARRRHVGHLIGQAAEFVGQQHPADETGISVVEIADGNFGARPEVVVNVVIEQTERAAVGVALKIASDPVKAIAESLGKQRAAGVEQQARGFDGAAGDHHQVGGLRLPAVVGVKILDRFRAAFGVEDDVGGDAVRAQLAVPGGERRAG